MRILVITSSPTLKDIRVRQTVKWLKEKYHVDEKCPQMRLKQHKSQLWIIRLPRKKYDLIWCNDLDTVLFGFILKFKYGTKIIYDSHDIYLYQLQRGKEILFLPYFWFIEKIAKKTVDLVVIASEGYREHFKGFKQIELIENVKSNSCTG